MIDDDDDDDDDDQGNNSFLNGGRYSERKFNNENMIRLVFLEIIDPSYLVMFDNSAKTHKQAVLENITGYKKFTPAPRDKPFKRLSKMYRKYLTTSVYPYHVNLNKNNTHPNYDPLSGNAYFLALFPGMILFMPPKQQG